MPEEASASARPAIVIPPALEPIAAKKCWVVWKLWIESGKDRSAEYHCGTQSIDEIARLPVAPLAADDCALLLWCTWSHIAIGSHIKIVEACGFRPCPAAFNWVKTNADGSLFGGTGYYTRSGGEVCLFATNVQACLTAREFLHSLLTWRSRPTPKQMAWLTRGYESLP
jgi:N6-adenosine-specific RNA methylase IME4